MANNRQREEQMGKNRASTRGDGDKFLVARIRGKIYPMPSLRRCCYKIPEKLCKEKENVFMPQIISFGPFHHGKDNLDSMEDNKKWYLHALISRTSTSLEDLVEALRALEADARECYAEPINLNSNDIVQMMLFDGCYIMEFFYYYGNQVPRNNNDPIFSEYWMLHSLLHDLILLENQLPFVVIECLFKLTRDPEQEGHSIDELVRCLFDAMTPTIGVVVPRKSSIDGKHLLDILRNKLLPSSLQMEIRNYSTWEFLHCVTDLEMAGVNLKKKNEVDGLLDITFNKDEVFEKPHFYFNDVTIVFLRNLIALEACDKYNTGRITSYAIFLDFLIKSPNNVRLLHKKGIIKSVCDDEEVDIIHQLDPKIGRRIFHYDGLCCRTNAYY